jgi:alpha-galactosidase
LGYDVVATDGGWWNGSDSGVIPRNASGFMSEDLAKFPEGMRALVDYVHSKHLRWGHYTDAGTHACNGDTPMSEGFEAQDAALFVSFGADMLKLDACAVTEPAQTVVQRWSALLNASGRPVLLSDCHNGCMNDKRERPAQQWAPWCADALNMWRTSRDISATWASVLSNLDTLKGMGARGAPGRWNDPDFLEVGIGAFADDGSAAALALNQAHFALWAVTSSPLMVGYDLREPAPRLLALVSNAAALAVNDAYAGNAGDFIRNVSALELWAKPLGNGSAAAVVVNRGVGPGAPVPFSVRLSEVPGLPAGASACVATDVWSGAGAPVSGGVFTPSVAPQSASFVVFSGCS